MLAEMSTCSISLHTGGQCSGNCPLNAPSHLWFQSTQSAASPWQGFCIWAQDAFPRLLTPRTAGAQVIRDKASQQSRGFAFVTFTSCTAAASAQAYMDGQIMYGPFGGQVLRVGPSTRAATGAGAVTAYEPQL